MTIRSRIARWLVGPLPKVVEPPSSYELERMASLVKIAAAEGRPSAPIPVEWLAATLAELRGRIDRDTQLRAALELMRSQNVETHGDPMAMQRELDRLAKFVERDMGAPLCGSVVDTAIALMEARQEKAPFAVDSWTVDHPDRATKIIRARLYAGTNFRDPVTLARATLAFELRVADMPKDAGAWKRERMEWSYDSPEIAATMRRIDEGGEEHVPYWTMSTSMPVMANWWGTSGNGSVGPLVFGPDTTRAEAYAKLKMPMPDKDEDPRVGDRVCKAVDVARDGTVVAVYSSRVVNVDWGGRCELVPARELQVVRRATLPVCDKCGCGTAHCRCGAPR